MSRVPFQVLLAAVLAAVMFVSVGTASSEDPPAPKAVHCSIRGNDSFSRRTLMERVREELDRYEKEGRQESHLEDAAFVLAVYYRSKGFPDARVAFEVTVAPAVAHVTFAVDEGSRIKVTEVEFRGNESIPDDRLEDFVPVSRTFRPRYLVEGEVRRNAGAVRGYYVSLGFVDARADEEIVRNDATMTATVILTVDEGPKIVLRDVTVDGNRNIAISDLWEAFEGFVGGPYNRGVAEEIRSRVVYYYANHGFPDIEVDVTAAVDRDAGIATVTATVTEGEPHWVGEIEVLGNERTWDETVRKYLTFAPAEPFQQQALFRSESRLYGSGLFSRVRIRERGRRRDGDRNVIDFDVEVEERDPYRFEVYTGWGSYEKLRIGTSIGFINLFGGGRSIEGTIAASTVSARGEIRLIDPFLLGERLHATTTAFLEYREFPSYDLRQRGGQFAVETHLAPRLRLIETIQYSKSSTSNLSRALEEEDVGSLDVTSLTTTLNWDLRDNPIDPASGGMFSLSYEWANQALGSDIDFHRATFDSRGYYSIFDGWVLGGRFTTGIIDPYGPTDSIPIQERFFNGGADSVRSFKWYELGPSVNGDPVGGEASTTLGVELRFPIWDLIHGAAFWDAGNVIEDLSDYGFRDLRQGVGGGLRAVTPVGPVRLDLGVNPDRDSGEDSWNVHFSVGYPF